MSLYKQFKTNADLEKAGIVLEYGKNSKGKPIEIRVARAGGANSAYLKRLDVRTKPHRRHLQHDIMEREKLEEIILETFVETVLLGWEGVEDEQGNDLPFNKANAIKLFTDLPDLYLDVQDQASKFLLFREDIREVDAKNS